MCFIKLPYRQINNYLLLLLAFFITISIYITDVVILLLFFSWLISGGVQKKMYHIFSSPIIYSTILFFIYFLIRHFSSGDWSWNNTIQKQCLILLLPILYTSQISQKYIKNAKYVFVMGLCLNIFLSILTFIYPSNPFFKKGHYDSNLFAHGFLDHFDYSIFLCFGIMLTLFLSQNKKQPWKYFLLIIILLIVLLNSYGRIGIISLIILLPIILIQFKNSKIKILSSILGLIVILSSYFFFSPFHDRVNETISNIKLFYSPLSFEQKVQKDAIYVASKEDSLTTEAVVNKIMKDEKWITHIANKKPRYETSLGKRFIYIKNSIKLIEKKPFWGYGVGEFQSTYEEVFKHPDTRHPHNNFIFIWVELGLFGVCLLLYIFYCQIQMALQCDKEKFLKFVFPLFFLFIMLFDNYFLNHNTLTFFCLFSFIIYHSNAKSN